MFEMFSRVMPIMVLFALGYVMKRKEWVSNEGIDGIKKVVINFALPAVLFKTFSNMTFEIEYIGFTLSIIGLLILMFLGGKVMGLFKGVNHRLNPYLSTGVAFGLLGIPLFTIVFGEENLGVLSILGLGNEIFVWFIFYTILHMQLNNEKFSLKYFAGFFKSPVIIAIFMGLTCNLLGLSDIFTSNPLLIGIYRSMDYMGSVATPLILVSIGYGMSFNKKYMVQTVKLVAVRMIVVCVVGVLFKVLVIDNLFEVTQMMNYAYMTFLMLPPLFSLPIFIGLSGSKEDEEIASNVVVTYTAISLVLFMMVAIIFI